MTTEGVGGERRSLLERAASPRAVTLGFAGIWFVLLIVPLVGLLAFSVLTVVQFHLELKPTLSAWREVLGSGRGEVMLRTLRIVMTVTMIELLIAFPFAFWLSKQLKSIPVKVAILTLTVVPFFLSSSARTIVWRPILSSTGLLNNLLVETARISAPRQYRHFGPLYFPFPRQGSPRASSSR
jgi:spermidine/putrescine transport system permease protein